MAKIAHSNSERAGAKFMTRKLCFAPKRSHIYSTCVLPTVRVGVCVCVRASRRIKICNQYDIYMRKCRLFVFACDLAINGGSISLSFSDDPVVITISTNLFTLAHGNIGREKERRHFECVFYAICCYCLLFFFYWVTDIRTFRMTFKHSEFVGIWYMNVVQSAECREDIRT